MVDIAIERAPDEHWDAGRVDTTANDEAMTDRPVDLAVD